MVMYIGPCDSRRCVREQTAVPDLRRLRSWPSDRRVRCSVYRRLDEQVEHPTTQIVEHAMARIAEDAVRVLTSSDDAAFARCAADPMRTLLPSNARSSSMVLNTLRGPRASVPRIRAPSFGVTTRIGSPHSSGEAVCLVISEGGGPGANGHESNSTTAAE